MFRRCLRVVVPALMLVASGDSVFAQRAAGPYSGLLGASDADARHSLDLRGSFFGSWEDLTTAAADPSIDDRFVRGGGAAGASGGLTHARRSEQLLWLSSANSSLRMYGTDSDAIAATFAARSSVSRDISSRVSLTGGGGWRYSPYYQFAPGLDGRLSDVGAFGGGFGVATAAQRNTALDGTAGATIRLSRRDSLEFSGSARRERFLDQSDSSITSWSGNGAFRHSLTRSLGVHAGFGRDEVRYHLLDRSVSTDRIDVGLDYGDTLTFSRRTAVSFSSSTSAVRWEDETHYRVNGSAALTRALGRTGSASLRYVRDTEFRAGFRQPLLSDTFGAGINDQIGRRAQWSAQAAYMRGTVGFDSTDDTRYQSYNVAVSLTAGLTRHLGLFSDYQFYRYDVPAGTTVFTFLPRFSRHTVSAGLTLWLPVINDKRSSRDTR